MIRFLSALMSVGVLSLTAGVKAADAPAALNFKMKSIDGKEIDLAKYKGKVVLFVNVASECGYTPQYAGLQKLYATHEKDGLVVIGVPANEFGQQEPGSNAEIAQFCERNYKVTFPMLAKVVVQGKGVCPLYAYLTSKESGFGGDVGWNFEKFLIGRDGKIAARFKSDVEPDADVFVKAIKTELEKSEWWTISTTHHSLGQRFGAGGIVGPG
jgi:glutathione peroxidase